MTAIFSTRHFFFFNIQDKQKLKEKITHIHIHIHIHICRTKNSQCCNYCTNFIPLKSFLNILFVTSSPLLDVTEPGSSPECHPLLQLVNQILIKCSTALWIESSGWFLYFVKKSLSDASKCVWLWDLESENRSPKKRLFTAGSLYLRSSKTFIIWKKHFPGNIPG